MKPVQIKLYIIALIATLGIFSVAVLTSSYINARKTADLRALENKIAVDILSFETQFDIIEESSCKSFDKSSLRTELDNLSQRLTYLEGQVGKSDEEVFRLKRYFSLLQIRDYLLTKKMSEQCNFDTTFILYFYTQNESCAECNRQNLILRAVNDMYPEIEIYSFDYNLDVPAINTLISLHHIPSNPPIIDINGKVYAPFQSLDDIIAVLQPLIDPVASTTATSTVKSR